MSRLIVLCNAFSLSMLDSKDIVNVQVTPLSLVAVKEFLRDGFVSFVGHQDTANILSNMLGITVNCNRTSFKADSARMIVAQYVGSRLPEGATVLPEGAKIEFKGVIWEVPSFEEMESDLIYQAETMH